MNDFLSAAEINIMQKDMSDMLGGAGGAPITIRHLTSVAGGTWDETYQQYIGGTKVFADISAQAIQFVIGERHKDLLEFASVKSGDCLFSMLPSVDLEGLDEVTIIDPDGGVWIPVVGPTRAFYEYIDPRVGSTQLTQSILTRLQQ